MFFKLSFILSKEKCIKIKSFEFTSKEKNEKYQRKR